MVFLIMGSVLPGYMFRYQYCLVGGLEAIVFGSIRWCVWSFRPSSPLRLPHLKCLLLLYNSHQVCNKHVADVGDIAEVVMLGHLVVYRT